MNICVVKPWLFKLSWKEQTVLLLALRGCDNVGKNDISEKIVCRLRNVILNNTGHEDNEFIQSDIGAKEIYDFSKNIGAYPGCFILHLIHASEIVGYCCDDSYESEFFRAFYLIMVDAFHMLPETEEKMHQRLADGAETYCHKT